MSFKDTVLTMFSPPGEPFVNDILDQNKLTWSNTRTGDWIENEITATNDDGTPLQGPNGIIRTPLDHFFDGRKTSYNTTQIPTPITWTAFPHKVSLGFYHFGLTE
jgi:hypothetical protein